MSTAVYGTGIAGSFTDPTPLQYTTDALTRRKEQKFTVDQVLTIVKKRLAMGRVVSFEFRKYPGPPSVGPEGFRTMTPIPASIYIRALPNNQLGIETERSGFEAQKEQVSFTDLPARYIRWLKMPYLERVEYVDSTDFKVIIARRSQIYGIEEASIPAPRAPQVTQKTVAPAIIHEEAPGPLQNSTNQWLLVIAIVLFVFAGWTYFSGGI